MLLREIGERPARERISEDAVEADLDMTALHRLIGHHLVQRACQRVPDALRAREQLLPELGQGDAARLALEQRQAEQILERADQAADSRVGPGQFDGSLTDAAEARGNDEIVGRLTFHY